MARSRKLLLVGATGAVGQAVLTQALERRDISSVTAITRRALGPEWQKYAKLRNAMVDFSALAGDAEYWACDAVICTLGTTIKIAGSQAAFAKVDRDLPIETARYAKAAGATRYALNSSLGASIKGNFYLRTKAEAEQGIIDLGFASTTLVRPSLIDAARETARPAEHLGILAARLLRPVIPARYRAVTPEKIARALLDGVLKGDPGIHIIESESL